MIESMRARAEAKLAALRAEAQKLERALSESAGTDIFAGVDISGVRVGDTVTHDGGEWQVLDSTKVGDTGALSMGDAFFYSSFSEGKSALLVQRMP